MPHDTEPPPSSDRRNAARHLACFPAEVQRPDGETRYSIIRDLSITGALLLVRTELGIGDHVVLQLHLSDKIENAVMTRGRVVRVEPLAEDEVGLWTRKIGVQFERPIAIARNEVEALRERRERLGLKL